MSPSCSGSAFAMRSGRGPSHAFANSGEEALEKLVVGIKPMLATYSPCKTRAGGLGKLDVDQVEIKST